MLHGCTNVLLGSPRCVEGIMSDNEKAEEGARQGASGAVGGAGGDMVTRKPVGLAGGGKEHVVGRLEVSAGGEDADSGAI